MVIQGLMPRQRRVMLHDVSLHSAKGIHGGKEEAVTTMNVTVYRERCQLGLLGQSLSIEDTSLYVKHMVQNSQFKSQESQSNERE